MNYKTLKSLRRIRKNLESRYLVFPEQCCWEASKEIGRNLGFRIIAGTFRGRNHHWNVTAKGEIVDLTVQQFDKSLPEIYVVRRNSPEAEDYLEGGLGE